MIYINEQWALPIGLAPTLKKYTQVFCKKLKLEIDISITFCNKNFIQELNQRYRHINKPTDVLSFDGGDIIISVPVVRENAKKYKNTFAAETLYMIIHGLCHLQGHDHGTKTEIQIMRKTENQLLQILSKNKIIVAGRI
jgi:probable rRNA maturation factor